MTTYMVLHTYIKNGVVGQCYTGYTPNVLPVDTYTMHYAVVNSNVKAKQSIEFHPLRHKRKNAEHLVFSSS